MTCCGASKEILSLCPVWDKVLGWLLENIKGGCFEHSSPPFFFINNYNQQPPTPYKQTILFLIKPQEFQYCVCDVIISEYNTGCVNDQDPSFKIGIQDLKACFNTIPSALGCFPGPKVLYERLNCLVQVLTVERNPVWISSELCCSAPLAKTSVTLRSRALYNSILLLVKSLCYSCLQCLLVLLY